jgi:hypothetical protein
MMYKSVLIFHRDGYELRIVRYSPHFSATLHTFMLDEDSLYSYHTDLLCCNKEDNERKILSLHLIYLISSGFLSVFQKEGQMYLLYFLDILQKYLSDFILTAKIICFTD